MRPLVRSLGLGVAYELSAGPVEELRSTLVAQWGDALTAQDRQSWRPHVTVQNKVAPDVARRLHAELSAQPLPVPATALGLALWRYVGGPWEHLHTHAFQPDPASRSGRSDQGSRHPGT